MILSEQGQKGFFVNHPYVKMGLTLNSTSNVLFLMECLEQSNNYYNNLSVNVEPASNASIHIYRQSNILSKIPV